MLMVLSTLYYTSLSVVSGCLEIVGKLNNYLELLDVPDTWVLGFFLQAMVLQIDAEEAEDAWALKELHIFSGTQARL
jgi:hypothetical protein